MHGLEAQGAHIVLGELTDADALWQATGARRRRRLGGREIFVDGQLALARAAHEQGAWRMIPSDFALNLFAATPGGHPGFDRRRTGRARVPTRTAIA